MRHQESQGLMAERTASRPGLESPVSTPTGAPRLMDLLAGALAFGGRGDAVDGAIHLQRMIGNRATSSALGVAGDRSLVVHAPDDALEREAHRVAAEVTGSRSTDATPSSPSPGAAGRGLSRVAGGLSLARGQGAVGGGVHLDSGFRGAMARARGEGQPIDADTRAALEPGFGVDFTAARVHAGGAAAGLCRRIGAEAFTHGADIFFAEGRYRPTTTAGRGLLAHELAHTIQQRGLVGGGERPHLGSGRSSTIQGLITRADFVKLAGSQRAWGWLKGSRYQVILKALDSYHRARTTERRALALDAVIAACADWRKHHTEDTDDDFRRDEYIPNLQAEAEAEKTGITGTRYRTPTSMIDARAAGSDAVDAMAEVPESPDRTYQLVVKAHVEHRLYGDFAERRAKLKAWDKVTPKWWSSTSVEMKAAAAKASVLADDPTLGQAGREADLVAAARELGASGVGHTWVCFDQIDSTTGDVVDHQTFGFYPAIALAAHTMAARSGAVHHPDHHDRPVGGNVRGKTYELSHAAYSLGLARCAALIKSPPDYEIGGYNCTKFASDVTSAVGVELPKAYFTLPNLHSAWNPNTLYDSIGDGT